MLGILNVCNSIQSLWNQIQSCRYDYRRTLSTEIFISNLQHGIASRVPVNDLICMQSSCELCYVQRISRNMEPDCIGAEVLGIIKSNILLCLLGRGILLLSSLSQFLCEYLKTHWVIGAEGAENFGGFSYQEGEIFGGFWYQYRRRRRRKFLVFFGINKRWYQ